jgi:hypothetical protein
MTSLDAELGSITVEKIRGAGTVTEPLRHVVRTAQMVRFQRGSRSATCRRVSLAGAREGRPYPFGYREARRMGAAFDEPEAKPQTLAHRKAALDVASGIVEGPPPRSPMNCNQSGSLGNSKKNGASSYENQRRSNRSDFARSFSAIAPPCSEHIPSAELC